MLMRRKTIIVVDDHADAASALAEALRLSGYEVHTANEGASALQLARDHDASAMIVDLVMPGMNGFEVARQAREAFGRTVMLIALSGYGERSNRQRGLEAGFNHYLLKPVSAQNILSLLEPD